MLILVFDYDFISEAEIEDITTMADQIVKARNFKSLHIKNNPLILYNIWDAGTAEIVADAGAKAIATGSWAVAKANGKSDGEKLPIETAMNNLKLIVDVVDLPVSIDIEGGYGSNPQQVADTVVRAIASGAVGINLEDQIIGANALYEIDNQVARLAAVRKAIDTTKIPAFINARTDIFLQASPDAQTDLLLNKAIERAKAYHQAGADGFFVPGLIDKAAIKTLCEISPLPINIMVIPNCPSRTSLAELGVARISYGPSPYQETMNIFAVGAKAIYSSDNS